MEFSARTITGGCLWNWYMSLLLCEWTVEISQHGVFRCLGSLKSDWRKTVGVTGCSLMAFGIADGAPYKGPKGICRVKPWFGLFNARMLLGIYIRAVLKQLSKWDNGGGYCCAIYHCVDVVGEESLRKVLPVCTAFDFTAMGEFVPYSNVEGSPSPYDPFASACNLWWAEKLKNGYHWIMSSFVSMFWTWFPIMSSTQFFKEEWHGQIDTLFVEFRYGP